MGLLFVKTADGRKKPSIVIWIIFVLIGIGVSAVFIFHKGEAGMAAFNTKKNNEKKEALDVAPIAKAETQKSESGGTDAETINSMQEQIKRETDENGGYLSPDRKREIVSKYKKVYEQKQSANFKPTVSTRIADMNAPSQKEEEPEQKSKGKKGSSDKYMTLAERLEAEGIKKNGNGGNNQNMAVDYPSPKNQVDNSNTTNQNSTLSRANSSQTWNRSSNLMPLGTFIPCVLDGDVITSDLSAHVWANVVLDVTFRRQLQLPKGLVRIRGTTATTPVQNFVDIHFDTMVFSDGTELPLSGYAYAAFDPRYPNRYRTRGIPGDMIVPPYYLKIESLLLTAGLGASDAYIQNFVNQNTTTPGSFTTIPTINPTTGQVQNTIQQSQGQPVNSNIGATAGLSAGQAALQSIVKDLQADLQKYKPYVLIEKGTPLYVQLDTTVDINSRQVNGTAIAEEAQAIKAQGGTVPRRIYAPGDAQSSYIPPDSGLVGTATTPAGAQGTQQAMNSFLKQLNSLPPYQSPQQSTAPSIAPAPQTIQPQGANTGAQLENALQNIGAQ